MENIKEYMAEEPFLDWERDKEEIKKFIKKHDKIMKELAKK
tara:strand:- start:717 stop:839 length:123 start_codon:yes stop_codon:yes gene_type:complete